MNLQWWGVGLILLIVYIPATNGLNYENAAGSGIQYSREFLLQSNSNSNTMDIQMAHLIPDTTSLTHHFADQCPVTEGKEDELSTTLRFQHEYREACLLGFTETCLDDRVPDREVASHWSERTVI